MAEDDAFSRAFGVSGDEPKAVKPSSGAEEDAFSRAFKPPPAIPEPEIVSPDTLEGAASSAMAPAVAEIGKAAAEGYRNTPGILTPGAREAVSAGGPVGRYVVNPLLDAAGAGLAGMNALFAGGARAVEGTTAAAGVPALGRDITMGMQILPAAAAGRLHPSMPPESPNPLRGPAQTADVYPARAEPMLPAPAFVPPDAALPPQRLAAVGGAPPPAFVPSNPLAADQTGTPLNANALAAGQDGRQVAAAGAAEPQTAVAAPGNVIGLTKDQEAAYRGTAEGQKLLQPQPIGIPDRNAYVDRVNPNLVEQEQTVNTARELKDLGLKSDVVSQGAREAAASNNEARREYFQNVARSPVDVANAEDARQVQAEADLKSTWANKATTDPTPVLQTASDILSSPDGRRPAVRAAVNSVVSELRDDKGNLYTDPEQLYGVRKHIDDLLSKEGQRDTPMAARATANLMALKSSLDPVIEAGANGFRQYLQNFSDASRKIDEMKVLQGHEKALYNTAGGQMLMTYNGVQRMMKNIVDARQTGNPLNPYNSITPDTMQKLWNLRDDLRRSASALELARTPGSDTAQNLWDMVRGLATTPEASAALHSAVFAAGGPHAVGALMLGRRLLAPLLQGRTAGRQTQRGLEMLRPNIPLNDLSAPPP